MLGMTIKAEAEKFIREYGQSAYDEVREAIDGARRRRNARLERFLVKVARQIELYTEKATGSSSPSECSKDLDDQ